MVAILSQQREVILGAVRAMYTEVANHPEKTFHFPTGRAACAFVGYPVELLDRLPDGAVESFAGVGFPFAADVIRPGDFVLDIGSGSGTDALIASLLTGPGGRVVGLDITETMQAKLTENAARMGARAVVALVGDAEEIPLPSAGVDVVTSNGVLNLVPDKGRALRQIFRVLRPGGRVQISDIVLGRPASDASRSNPRLWAECVVGATTERAYLRLFRSAGFTDVEVLSRLDYFSGSASEATREVAAIFGAVAVTMRARKPEAGEVVAVVEEDADEDGERSIAELGTLPQADRVLDAGANGCGEIAPLVRKELGAMAPGQLLGVRSEAPEVGTTLAAWCRLAGHELVGTHLAEEGVQIHYIRRKSD